MFVGWYKMVKIQSLNLCDALIKIKSQIKKLHLAYKGRQRLWHKMLCYTPVFYFRFNDKGNSTLDELSSISYINKQLYGCKNFLFKLQL